MLDFNTVSDTKPRILIPKRYREQSRHFYRESPPSRVAYILLQMHKLSSKQSEKYKTRISKRDEGSRIVSSIHLREEWRRKVYREQ